MHYPDIRSGKAWHHIHVGILPSRGDIGIFIWVVAGLNVIVFRLIECPKMMTGSENSRAEKSDSYDCLYPFLISTLAGHKMVNV